MAVGAVATMVGFTDCKKDSKTECCSMSETYTYYGVTYSFDVKACSDGTYTMKYTYDGRTVTETGNWDDEDGYSWADSWAELKEEAEDDGAECS